MKHWDLLLVIIMVAAGTHAADVFVAETIPISEPQEFSALYTDFQLAYLPIIPPAEGEMFLQPVGSVVPFDQSGFKTRFLKNLIGTMHPVSGAPIYTIFAMEDASSGEIIIFNEDLSELARFPRQDGYDPTAWAVAEFGSSVTPYLLALYNPARMIAEYQIIPSEYYSDHVAALEAEAAALPMMAMSSPPPPGGTNGIPVNIGPSTNNLLVELTFSLSGDSGRYIEVFRKDNLVYSPSWEVGDSWIPTYGNSTISWIDPSSSNHMQRFYLVSDGADADGDGFSDLREAWVSGTESNVFNLVDADGDGMHDFWETKLFGDLSQVGSGDFDGDGLLNNEEMVFDSGEPSVAVLTDPSLFSSDGDELGDGEQFASPPTDPWNSDTAPPVVAVVSPTNETVIVP